MSNALYRVLISSTILLAGVMIGFNLPDKGFGETYVVGTPSYHIDGYMINFKEPSRYGESYDSVSDNSLGYTTGNGYIVIKSGEELNTVDETCVHEVAHNENPDRKHPENGSSPWFERQESMTSREVCEKLKQKLLEDRDKYLRVG